MCNIQLFGSNVILNMNEYFFTSICSISLEGQQNPEWQIELWEITCQFLNKPSLFQKP